VTLLLGGFVYTQIQISQSAVARSVVEGKVAAEAVRIEQLRSEVARLESPARVMDEARRMGMVVPETVEFLRLRR
jgi:cell division protein FtsL